MKSGRSEDLKALSKRSLGREEELNSFITDLEEQHSKLRTLRIGRLGQDQDQDSLLVKRHNDNHSPGPVIRELLPSSHQRSELSNTILCIFSR